MSNRFVNSLTVYHSNDEALIYFGTDSKIIYRKPLCM